ncbi:uncharacterized protein LOC132066010 [Lycium ferocissimum]|uniref:uncharacterized protein LOC132066010 n=1 Tax=Lycium ferocissimum TaxID=112874 RepID=UPI00281535A1|nr:uncharacterized protein LOC132066010 [Lycium ferocissimum]
MMDNYKCRHEQLPYALLGYRTTTWTSTGTTLYLLVYGIEAIKPAKVVIPSLRIIQDVELENIEWVQNQYEQLALIDEKRMVAVCHGQLYRYRITRAFKMRVRARLFQIGQMVLKRVFPRPASTKEVYTQFGGVIRGPVRVLFEGAMTLAEMDDQEWPKAINSNAIKRYYV